MESNNRYAARPGPVPHRAAVVLMLAAAAHVTACGEFATSPSSDDPVPREPDTAATLVVDSVSELHAGQDGYLYGQAMDRITQVTADGETVTFEILSDEEVRFEVPEGAACEVDGRSMEVVVNNAARLEGPLRVEDVLQLEVGESRILRTEDLSCLQFPSGVHDFVLSAASFSTDLVKERVMRLHTPDHEAPSVAGDVASMATPAGATHHVHPVGAMDAGIAAQVATSYGEPFDDYANAEVGDTLQFVDWDEFIAAMTAETRDEVPTYTGVVVAVEGDQMIVVDTRLGDVLADDYPTLPSSLDAYIAEYQEQFTEAARTADQYTVPAIQAVMDPDFEPLQNGAGGRMVTMIRDFSVGGMPVTAESKYNSWSSGMVMGALNPYVPRSAEVLSGYMIHEYAHVADVLTTLQGGAQSLGWYSEAAAVHVSDIAARMSAGGPEAADPDRATVHARTVKSPDRSAQVYSPWGDIGGARGSASFGSYDRGARILRYAQQVLNEQDPSAILHERLAAKAVRVEDGATTDAALDSWHIQAIAAEVGMSPEYLMRESMLADLTDDLVPAEAVARFGLPQIAGWVHGHGAGARDSDMVFPGGYSDLRAGDPAFSRGISIPAGGYAYLYIMSDSAQGVSLQADQEEGVNLQPHQELRVIRLR